jgi:hypothetical protein
MANQSGQAYAFMAITPVLPGREDELGARLAAWGSDRDSPLARMGSTHFARFVVLHDLVYQGPPQVRDSLQSAYLVFVSNFDGDLERYLESMLDLMADEAEEVWGLCVGFPGTADRDKFFAYLLHNQVDTTFFVSAYPGATVPQVHSSLDLRRRVADFAIAAQGMDHGELMAAWRAGFPEVSR